MLFGEREEDMLFGEREEDVRERSRNHDVERGIGRSQRTDEAFEAEDESTRGIDKENNTT